jgi:predicted nucleotidyltransferase
VRREEIESLLRARIEAERDVLAAWLFGSVARGEARPDSDVDVAILTGRPRPRRLEDLPVELEAALCRALGRTVQVVVVDHAPADLVHRVLRDGVLLVDRDRSARIRFEVAARNRYFDMQPIWREYRSRVGKRSA